MTGKSSQWNDQQIEVIVGNLLRAGVILSAAVVGISGVIYLARHGGQIPQDHIFHSEPPQFRTLTGLFRWRTLRTSLGGIEFGLILLILTPVARVAFSLYAFARERDRMYMVFTAIVLALLCYSLASA